MTTRHRAFKKNLECLPLFRLQQSKQKPLKDGNSIHQRGQTKEKCEMKHNLWKISRGEQGGGSLVPKMASKTPK